MDAVKKPTYHIHVLSNSHWDREWYMSHEKYLARLVPLMDRLVTIMDTQPSYLFVMDGQYAMQGIDLTPIESGKVYKLAYTIDNQ